MSAPLTSTGAQQYMPTTAQSLKPVSMDQSRDVDRQDFSPNEQQIQALQAPSAQSQATNQGSDSASEIDNKDVLESIMAIKELQKTGELPDRGAILDIHT